MTEWLLILTLSVGSSVAIKTIEMKSGESCEIAGSRYEYRLGHYFDKAMFVCIKR